MEKHPILTEAKEKMHKAVEHCRHELNTLHTGKASPAMVENVMVEAYGSPMRLMEVAAITTPDARTISIQPWDKSVLQNVEKAIQKENLGLNPVVKGTVIICPIPELSKERRAELSKMAHGMGEQAKIGVRAARHDAMDAVKELDKKKEISEDERTRLEKDVQKLTDTAVGEIDSAVQAKEKDLMTM